jgi:DNA polymerase III subunit alpha
VSSAGKNFAHLHVHTEYSMLDGAARVKDLFAEAARMEMPALAITDHGNLFGAFEFYKQGKAAGVKPIIGIEAYVAPGTRWEKRKVTWAEGGEDDVSGGGAYTHMTLLSRNNVGMHNLFRLASLASLEGYYYKPRMDRELLSTYAEGLIGTSGCVGGEIATRLRMGQYDEARKAAADYSDIFGPENFYIEIMDHGLEIERRVQADLLRIARDLKLPLLATNDLHYTFEADSAAHEVLLCVQSGATLADPKRFKFEGHGYYLKSAAQMRELWKELPEACDNTLLIAESCDVSFAEGVNLMPRFPVPAGESEESWLIKEVEIGLQHRFRGAVPDAHRKQAAYEVGVIGQMGFPGYFLVVADLVRHAKEHSIRVGPGRGSAAGSVVAWALGITELDPIKFGLVFERFLNPERVSMPDIDIDFDERRRGDMIRYATERYGEEHVAQIITYGTIKAKQALKDSARVLGYPYAMGEKLTKALPPSIMGKDIPLSGIFDADHERYSEASEFRDIYDTDVDAKRVIDTAMGLEGLKRQWGVHAAGVILSKDPLIDVIPIQRREADGAIITQFDMGACEALGLLKMDFLGLRNLTVLDDALIHIRINQGVELVLEELPLDDRTTYDLLSRGDTLGVFQLDGGPMRALLRAMAPDSFEDISAVLALYRPGPMGANAHNDYADRKNGRKPVVAIHPELREPLEQILGDTYGLIVYQEQVMAIAEKLAGYSPGSADLLRRAMGKKKKEILDKEYIPFAAGMQANGFSDSAVAKLWEILVPFSDYAFNKAHTAGYGLVSYWTGFLKANYPSEYMAALLSSVRDDKDKMAPYLNECRRMGIKVLPPDVNDSDADFTPRGTDIRFGLTAIRNVGANVVSSIVETRRSKGRFLSFQDFLFKVDAAVCNRKTIESLIKAGAFDSLGHTRRGLMAIAGELIDSMMENKRAEAIGQFDLFGDDQGQTQAFQSAPEIETSIGEWEKSLLLTYEREMLGLYVSDHPLLGIDHVLSALTDRPISSVFADEVNDGQVVTVGGLITGLQRKISRQGNAWAIVTLEDLEGAVDVMFFAKAYEAAATLLAEDVVIVVKARVDKRDDTPRLMGLEISVPDINQGPRGPVVVSIAAQRCTPPVVERLKEVLRAHPGTTEVHLRLESPGRNTMMKLDEGLRVSASPSLMADLKQLLGSSAIG